MQVIAIPQMISDIDANWLEQALSVNFPDIKVKRATFLESLGGACTKARFRLETNQPNFPDTVIVKGCFEPHSVNMREMQFKEAAVYRDMRKSLSDVETVMAYFAQADRDMGSVVIMEDLAVRDVRCLTAKDTINDLELAHEFVALIAQVHEKWWGMPELASCTGFTFAGGLDHLIIPRNEAVISSPQALAREMALPRAAMVPEAVRDGVKLGQAMKQLRANIDDSPLVFAHGDLHLANLYLTREGRPGVLDWTPLRVPWAFDLAYFIGGCLSVENRRSWESQLLRYYWDRIGAYGMIPPSLDEAFDTYSKWLVWGLYVWLFNIPAYHSEDNICLMTERYGVALADHHVFDRHFGL